MGIEEALRRDLSGTLAEQLDKQVLVGGASPNFGGFLSTPAQGGLAARADTPALVDFSLAAAELALGIDGKYAGGLDEVCSVVGTSTARKLATVFQTNDSAIPRGRTQAGSARGRWRAQTSLPLRQPFSRVSSHVSAVRA